MADIKATGKITNFTDVYEVDEAELFDAISDSVEEVVTSAPKGYDLDTIEIGDDLCDPEALVVGKLPNENIYPATTEQQDICLDTLKSFIKRGYIDIFNSYRLLLVSFSDKYAIFGSIGLDADGVPEYGSQYRISIGVESISVSFCEM